jgi:lipoprotein-anchoring transpeptidase ErfK/SrfK
MPTRRSLLTGLGLAGVSAALPRPALAQYYFYEDEDDFPASPDEMPAYDPSEWYVGHIPDGDRAVPVVDRRRIPPEYHPQRVLFRGPERAGTVVVDTGARFLYLVEAGGTAIRYGIGVGRQGFRWSGVAEIRRKARWPGWTPPAEMIKRRPDLPRYMPGGIHNPLGARALYLYQGERDTLYRIHGTNEPWTIGGADSSGCIRMLNEDVLDLHDRVPIGTPVVVRDHARRWMG